MSEYNKVEMLHRTGFNLRDYLVVKPRSLGQSTRWL